MCFSASAPNRIQTILFFRRLPGPQYRGSLIEDARFSISENRGVGMEKLDRVQHDCNSLEGSERWTGITLCREGLSNGHTIPLEHDGLLRLAFTVRLYELLSKLLVSPLRTPTVVPYIIPYMTPLKEFRLWLIYSLNTSPITAIRAQQWRWGSKLV